MFSADFIFYWLRLSHSNDVMEGNRQSGIYWSIGLQKLGIVE